MIIVKGLYGMVARYKLIYQNNWYLAIKIHKILISWYLLIAKQNKNLQIVTLKNTPWWEFRFLPWCNNWYRISPLAENWRKCIRQLCTDNGQQTGRTVILETNQFNSTISTVLTWMHFWTMEGEGEPKQSKTVSLSWRRNKRRDGRFWKLTWLNFSVQNTGEKRATQKKSCRSLHRGSMSLVEY